MKVHLVDGTFELFRSFYGAPAREVDGVEVGATRGFLRSMAGLLRQPDVSHVAVAFDTVIESFRNEMFAGYKTGAGIEPVLLGQFPLVERAAAALGMTVWGMLEFEADDALATGAARYKVAPGVEQVVICTPDKDMCQCVQGDLVVCEDRIRKKFINEPGVREKFGVEPASIPDYLGLVGDTADGIPGLPRWGAKGSSTLLAEYKHIEAIPDDENAWSVKVRGAKGLAATLRERRADAMLYRQLAVLRTDVPLAESLEDIAYKKPDWPALEKLCAEVEEDIEAFSHLPR